jgi:hypothetical protein
MSYIPGTVQELSATHKLQEYYCDICNGLVKRAHCWHGYEGAPGWDGSQTECFSCECVEDAAENPN